MRFPLHRPALLLLLLGGAPLGAWGSKGHRVAAGLALRSLPPELRAWFQGQEEAFRDMAVEPDRWKTADRKEGPRHFLDTEAYGGPEGVPYEASEALRKVGSATFEKRGQLPWVIQDRYRALVEAFRGGDRDRVAAAAAYLSHYVGDAQVPLHTTENHDGQFTGQRGIHARWESGLVERYVEEARLEVAPARVEADLLRAPWAWIRASHALVPDLLAQEKAVDPPGVKVRPPAYWTAFWEAQGPVVLGQLRKSGQEIGNMILTAWTEAGRPVRKRVPSAPE